MGKEKGGDASQAVLTEEKKGKLSEPRYRSGIEKR